MHTILPRISTRWGGVRSERLRLGNFCLGFSLFPRIFISLLSFSHRRVGAASRRSSSLIAPVFLSVAFVVVVLMRMSYFFRFLRLTTVPGASLAVVVPLVFPLLFLFLSFFFFFVTMLERPRRTNGGVPNA